MSASDNETRLLCYALPRSEAAEMPTLPDKLLRIVNYPVTHHCTALQYSILLHLTWDVED